MIDLCIARQAIARDAALMWEIFLVAESRLPAFPSHGKPFPDRAGRRRSLPPWMSPCAGKPCSFLAPILHALLARALDEVEIRRRPAAFGENGPAPRGPRSPAAITTVRNPPGRDRGPLIRDRRATSRL